MVPWEVQSEMHPETRWDARINLALNASRVPMDALECFVKFGRNRTGGNTLELIEIEQRPLPEGGGSTVVP